MKQKLIITANSTVLYIIAFLLTTIIHELAHAVFGLLNNSDPILHHNAVHHFSTEFLSIKQQVLIALAGPITSLLQGIIIGIVFIKFRTQGLLRLFLLWFSVLGFSNFMGYLMTGPIFKNGDIGKVFLLLNTPLFIQIIVALIGAAILIFIAYKLSIPFLNFSYQQQWVDSKQSRKNFSFHIIILPWIAGSLIVTVLYLPVIAIVSIIYPIMSGMIFIFPWQNAQRIENVSLSENKKIGELSALSIGLLVLLIIVFRFILAPGIQMY
jgi:hypothetical protein